MDKRPELSRPQCAQDWEDRKAVIMELYESKTLKETLRIMEDQHSFKATFEQYKRQLQKWDVDHKRIKSTEYKAMIRIKRQREECGQEDVKFQLRGVQIDDAKIVRFQKRHQISEPEQVSDCPTPPNLVCITPAPISPNPNLRLFDWYHIYEKYLDSSMAGASTMRSNDVQSILRSLIVPFHDYETYCWHGNIQIDTVYKFKHWHSRVWTIDLLSLDRCLVDCYLTTAMSAPKTHVKVLELDRLQKILGFIVSEYLEHLDNRSRSLSSLNLSEQLLVLWAAGIAGTIYRLSGRRGEATSLLETIIHLVEQDLDLEDTLIALFYNAMLVELAHCCAEDGHRNKARHLLNNHLRVPSDFDTLTNMPLIRSAGMFLVTPLKRRLRTSMKDVLQSIEGLEEGPADTNSTQEHHVWLRDGSCQPGTSEWGPFLTECVEWDKI